MTPDNNNESKPSEKEVFFRGKKVLITGGASGIGSALARQLADLGSTVTIIDIAPVTVSKPQISAARVDVSDKEALSKFQLPNKIDLLIIAAGVTSETNEPTEEEMSLMEKVNVNGVRNTLAVFGSQLSQDSSVVYIGTDKPPKDYYKKTKEEAVRLLEQFSRDFLGDVRIDAFGPVMTPLFKKGKTPEIIQKISKNTGIFTPEEAADVIIDNLLIPHEERGYPKQTVMYKK